MIKFHACFSWCGTPAYETVQKACVLEKKQKKKKTVYIIIIISTPLSQQGGKERQLCEHRHIREIMSYFLLVNGVAAALRAALAHLTRLLCPTERPAKRVYDAAPPRTWAARGRGVGRGRRRRGSRYAQRYAREEAENAPSLRTTKQVARTSGRRRVRFAPCVEMIMAT